VNASKSSVALYDLDSTRVLAVSDIARSHMGLNEVDLNGFDYISKSRDPDLVRSVVAMIKSEELAEWHLRTELRVPDGTVVFGYAHGRRVHGVSARTICLVRYTLGESESDSDEWREATKLLEPDDASAEPRGDRQLAGQVARLQQHLARIAAELEAAGVVSIAKLPEPGAVPGLNDLSARQWEVVTRLVRGERVATIAREMYLSPSTVRNHLATVYRRVGVRSQAELLELVHRAQREHN
jgi:DNA-binding CsgD family transcriptional regulator